MCYVHTWQYMHTDTQQGRDKVTHDYHAGIKYNTNRRMCLDAQNTTSLCFYVYNMTYYVRVAWSTHGRAPCGCTKLRHHAIQQVDMIKKRDGWKKRF